MKMNDDFLARMREATNLLRTSGPAAATAAIQRALHGPASPGPEGVADAQPLIDINPAPEVKEAPAATQATTQATTGHRTSLLDRLRCAADLARHAPHTVDVAETGGVSASEGEASGKFLSTSCTNQAGTRAGKLYVPSGYRGEPIPLIVMLHGCKQNPDDFAAGTGMNQVAEENTCFVLYPEQARAANGSNCWNWFSASDQQRDGGEPSIIADITRQAMRDYRIDPDRVYIAGLSAGGAMAAIVAAAYPEIYAAVGIHSGLPVGSAHDVASAFGAMKQSSKAARLRPYHQPVPAIVFHGDRDQTVHPDNGLGALAQSLGVASEEGVGRAPEVTKGQLPQGRAYTQTLHYDAADAAVAEHWIVHGAGHAWSGGTHAGSYTDPRGPDASREMLRFFYAHPRNAAA